MVSLLDIGPLCETVTLKTSKGPQTLSIYGIGADDMFALFNKFPEVRKLMNGEARSIKAQDLLDLGTKVCANIIACAMRDREEIDAETSKTPWDEDQFKKAIRIVSKFAVADQLKIINIVFALTFPDGVGPFVEQLRSLTATFTGVVNGLKQTAEEVSSTDSAQPSNGALLMDNDDARRGPLHRVN
jgi:hypothetical protein